MGLDYEESVKGWHGSILSRQGQHGNRLTVRIGRVVIARVLLNEAAGGTDDEDYDDSDEPGQHDVEHRSDEVVDSDETMARLHGL